MKKQWRAFLHSISIAIRVILKGSKSVIRRVVSVVLNPKSYDFPNALLTFLTAIIPIITYILRRKKVVRKKTSISDWSKERLKIFNTSSRSVDDF